MIQIPKDFRDFIRLLNDHGVEYLIVGGYAVAVHGYVRYTGDIDFFIASDEVNAEKMVQVFRDFGFSEKELKKELFLEEGNIIRIGAEPMRLEIVNEIDGVAFSQCYTNRIVIEHGDLKVNFIGLNDLITNKKATQRKKDEVDAEELEKRGGKGQSDRGGH